MKTKKLIIISLIILLILLFTIIIILLKNNSGITVREPNVVDSNIEENKNSVSNENSKNPTIEDYDKNVYYEKDGKLYTTSGEPAEGINLEIKGIPQNVLDYIEDVNALYNTIKVYVYPYAAENNVKVVTYSRYEYQKETNRLAIAFLLDDSKKTQIIIIVNLNNNTAEISY